MSSLAADGFGHISGNLQISVGGSSPVDGTLWAEVVPETGEGFLNAGLGIGRMYTAHSAQCNIRARVGGVDYFNVLQRM